MQEIRQIVNFRAEHADKPFALATVVYAEGSSYRRPGARMLVSVAGREIGCVSGGCVEKKVISRAQNCLLSGQSELLTFNTHVDGIDNEFSDSLGCHGLIKIWIEPLAPGQFWSLQQAELQLQKNNSEGVLITRYGERNCASSWYQAEMKSHLPASVGAAARGVLQNKKSQHLEFTLDSKPESFFLEYLHSAPSLVVFGCGYDVPPLLALAKILGYQTTVVLSSPRLFADLNFAADQVLTCPPSRVLDYLPLLENAAVLIMNHHYDTDKALLENLLFAPISYLGLLGPRSRAKEMLHELGWIGKDWPEVLHGPAGLDLGATQPEEIALSILAEIQAVQNNRNARSLRHRLQPIHAPLLCQIQELSY